MATSIKLTPLFISKVSLLEFVNQINFHLDKYFISALFSSSRGFADVGQTNSVIMLPGEPNY